ncbi:hypothetical protein DITRI_Ditri10aG0058800 [Diplodiscus trichospermus]
MSSTSPPVNNLYQLASCIGSSFLHSVTFWTCIPEIDSRANRWHLSGVWAFVPILICVSYGISVKECIFFYAISLPVKECRCSFFLILTSMFSLKANYNSQVLCNDLQVKELRAALGPLSGCSLKYCIDACLRRYLETQNWNVETKKRKCWKRYCNGDRPIRIRKYVSSSMRLLRMISSNHIRHFVFSMKLL